jgi:hypothetical protein
MKGLDMNHREPQLILLPEVKPGHRAATPPTVVDHSLSCPRSSCQGCDYAVEPESSFCGYCGMRLLQLVNR